MTDMIPKATENPLLQRAVLIGDVVDEESLLLEYQTQFYYCMKDTHADYELDQEQLSFEEWKMKRREFKQGTRKSFVKAFQVFEDRELLNTDR